MTCILECLQIRNNSDDGMAEQEMVVLYEQLKKYKPKVIIEIGARGGTSTLCIGKYMKKSNIKPHLWSIEPYPKELWRGNIKKYKLLNYVTLIEGCSPWIDHSCIPKPIDFLFIDGNHNMPYPVLDFFYWLYFMKKGGIIAIHDTKNSNNAPGNLSEVLKEKTECVEFELEDMSTRGLTFFRKVVGPEEERFVRTRQPVDLTRWPMFNIDWKNSDTK